MPAEQIVVESETASSIVVETIDGCEIVIETEIGESVIEIEAGATGLQGVPGPAGSQSFTAVVDSPVSGHRAVIRRVGGLDYADAAALSHAGRAVGLSTNAASAGGQVSVLGYGEITEPSWNWDTTKPVFLGANGYLTQTPPTRPGSAFARPLGYPISATTLFFDPEESTVLSE